MSARARGARLGVLLFGATTLSVTQACHGKAQPGERSDAVANASASAASAASAPSSSSAAAESSASAHGSASSQKCRAISVSGIARATSVETTGADAGPPLLLGELAEIPDDVWVELDRGGKLTAKHPHSTRETTFTGPARFRSCVAHGEESWLASGTFESVPTSGERPGAEQWVVTPEGVIRYASARLEVSVTATRGGGGKTEVKLLNGAAYAWTGDVASAVEPPESKVPATPAAPRPVTDGWIWLDGARTVTLTAKRDGKPDEAAKAAVDLCGVDAKAAKELASAVASPDASLAQVAPRHVNARHVARAACDVAALRVSRLGPSPAREAFLATLREADADWKSFRPHGLHGRKP